MPTQAKAQQSVADPKYLWFRAGPSFSSSIPSRYARSQDFIGGKISSLGQPDLHPCHASPDTSWSMVEHIGDVGDEYGHDQIVATRIGRTIATVRKATWWCNMVLN